MSLEKFLGGFLDWSKYSPRVLLALTFLCGFITFGNSEVLTNLGLETIQSEYRPYFGIGFLLSAIMFLSYPLVLVFKWTLEKGRKIIEKTERKKNYISWLKILTETQKVILRTFINKNTRTQQLNYEDGDVLELINAGIIYSPGNIMFFDRYKLDGMYTDFNLQPVVYTLLKQHPELLD
jgi:hypothetical protein